MLRSTSLQYGHGYQEPLPGVNGAAQGLMQPLEIERPHLTHYGSSNAPATTAVVDEHQYSTADDFYNNGSNQDEAETYSLLHKQAQSSEGAQRRPFVHPIPRLKRAYMVFIFCLTASLLFADQNLMAPNLTDIARDFGFSDQQRDALLGGVIGSSFFVVGAPTALLTGWLSHSYNRRNLLFITVILGEAPCIATYWVRQYWQLLILRLLTGISVGGIFPLIFSLLGDLFAVQHRPSISAVVQIATGAGLALGQLIAGFVGPTHGWRLPFVIVSVPTILLATLMLLTTEEPPRGVMEEALQEHYAEEEGFEYDEQIDWPKALHIIRIPTNACLMLQGLPGSLPWGMFLIFFNDFLHEQKGLSKQVATLVTLCWGLGGGVGVIAGGAMGQYLYNQRKYRMALFMGGCVILAIPPIIWVVNAPMQSQLALSLSIVAVFVGGGLASVPGPNIKAVLLNVNEPETRGVALALHVVADDLGKGLGPGAVAILISALGRNQAFTLSVAGWLPCGLLLGGAALFLERDAAAMQERLHNNVQLASSRKRSSTQSLPLAT